MLTQVLSMLVYALFWVATIYSTGETHHKSTHWARAYVIICGIGATLLFVFRTAF